FPIMPRFAVLSSRTRLAAAPLALLLSLPLLAACGDDPDPDFDAAAPGLPDVEEGAMPEAAAPAPGAEGAACLVGTWAVDAEHSFRPEMWENLAAGGEINLDYAGSSGQAFLT